MDLIERILERVPSPELQRAIDRKMCEFIFGKRPARKKKSIDASKLSMHNSHTPTRSP